MSENCLFCRIAAGEIPSDRVYESENVFAIRDIDPKAPVHVLIIPKMHITSILDEKSAAIAAEMFAAASAIAKEEGLDAKGFRCVMNTGEDAGQSVLHLHMHLLGGRSLAWPPG